MAQFSKHSIAVALLSTLCVACADESVDGVGAGEAGIRPRSVLLISLDTTIPEVLSCYGRTDVLRTPTLDEIASEGLLFENARTVAPMTLPSHASMLTGLYPLRHSVRVNGASVLPEEADTLAERAKEHGYQTAAFIAAVVLNDSFGLQQGFEFYDQPADFGVLGEADQRLEASRDGKAMVDVTLDWMRNQRDPERPFFVWLHLFDPHAPYEPPPEYLAAENGNPYAGEARFMDAEIGRLVNYLKGEDLWGETIVAVVADHGEALGRKGETTHATCVFDTTLRIPMLLRHPDGRRAGEHVKDVTSIVDLFPTLVEELRWGAAGDVDGFDLWGAALPADRGVYFESYYSYLNFGASPIAGWADSKGKYHHSSSLEFFGLPSDAGEEQNLMPGAADRSRPYAEALRAMERLPRLGTAALVDSTGQVSASLEALGYVGGDGSGSDLPEPTASSVAPSPHTRIRATEDFLEARRLQLANRQEQALPLLQRIVAENPRNHSASFHLGLAYMSLQRYEEALVALDLSIEHRSGSTFQPLLNKAVALQNLGRGAEAVPYYEQAFGEGDGPVGALEAFLQLLSSQGDEQRIEIYAQRLRER